MIPLGSLGGSHVISTAMSSLLTALDVIRFLGGPLGAVYEMYVHTIH